MDLSGLGAIIVGSAVVSALVTAVLGHWNELSRSREERRQARLAKTYIDVLGLALCLGDRASALDPHMLAAERPKLPEIPSYEDQRALRARLSAYGSPAMRAAYLVLQRLDRQFLEAVRAHARLQKRAEQSPDMAEELESARAKISDRAGQVRGEAVVMIELANAELAERRLRTLTRIGLRIGRAELRLARWVIARTRRVLRRNHEEKAGG
jgi:hypothetical protein